MSEITTGGTVVVQKAPVISRRINLKKRKDLHEKTNPLEILMLAPFVILFSIFTIVPFISSIILSFTDFNMLQIPRFVGIDNYIRLFVEDDVFLIAVRNTLVFAFLTGPISYFACLILAWLVNELPRRLRTVLTLLFYAPTIAGNMFMIWTFIFSGDAYGIVNGLLMKYGIISEPKLWLTDPKYNLGIIMLVQLWLSLGIGFLSFIAGLQSVDKQLYEAGSVDGIKNRFQELIYITLPSMGPQLMFGAVMQIAASFGVSTVCSALAGSPSTDYSAHTVVLHMQDYGTLRFEMGYASAIATVLFITVLLVHKVIKKMLGRFL